MEQISRMTVFLAKYMYALLSSVYLFMMGTLLSRHWSLITDIAAHFGFSPACVGPLVPRVALRQLVDAGSPVRCAEVIHEEGNTSLIELLALNMLVNTHQPKPLFEIDTFDGRSTLNMALNCAEGSAVDTLDLAETPGGDTTLPLAGSDGYFIGRRETGSRFRSRDASEVSEVHKIKQLYGDSATFDFGPYAGKVDLVFVDGSHSYEYAVNDTQIALDLLRDATGVIIWHDYGSRDGVTRALNELVRTHPEWELAWVEDTSLVCLTLET